MPLFNQYYLQCAAGMQYVSEINAAATLTERGHFKNALKSKLVKCHQFSFKMINTTKIIEN